ncbi:GyrI-like domain-containing protein [Paenibacillus aurantiacus]|uniref:GyrI-like domain-containing protein n=1 Tax=Paenibacillus aurantiacus TaxID=1936118 RepID=A0ABV5KSH7_9BACL
MMSNLLSKAEVNEQSGFTFVGTSARTTNAAEMSGQGVIGAKWESFFRDQVLQQIEHRKDDTILALYTDYESDESGAYTYALGAKAEIEKQAAAPWQTFVIPEQKYVVFTTRTGPIPEVVVEAWQAIWAWSKDNERAFTADFEVYDHRAADPKNSQVDIYIAVK